MGHKTLSQQARAKKILNTRKLESTTTHKNEASQRGAFSRLCNGESRQNSIGCETAAKGGLRCDDCRESSGRRSRFHREFCRVVSGGYRALWLLVLLGC